MSNSHTAYIEVDFDEDGGLTRKEWCELLEYGIEEEFESVKEVEVITAP